MNRSLAWGDASRLIAVLGPTNTGKTHLAVERMLGHASGMIGLPLRLLAREIYDRVAKTRGAAQVALITGEEKIVPPHPRYLVCTVEAMPLERRVEFLAVDEIQLCADPERGHVFTHRLLHARGSAETMLMGAATVASTTTAVSSMMILSPVMPHPNPRCGNVGESEWLGNRDAPEIAPAPGPWAQHPRRQRRALVAGVPLQERVQPTL